MAALALFAPLHLSAQAPLSPQDIAASAKSATVQIRGIDSSGRITGQGSGFFTSANGVLVTNYHVVENANSLQVETATGKIFENVFYVAADARRDMVILKIPIEGAPALSLGEDEKAQVGSKVYVMGNPLGQTATFSDGLVSAQRTINGISLLQITAPISPGSSGGPVMNDRGGK